MTSWIRASSIALSPEQEMEIIRHNREMRMLHQQEKLANMMIEQLLRQKPKFCMSCGAPLVEQKCEHCGVNYAVPMEKEVPEEPTGPWSNTRSVSQPGEQVSRTGPHLRGTKEREEGSH